MKIRKIITGGQTGVDRAALDAALYAGIPCGGWCPKGRWAEDGPIGQRYPLRETDSPDPSQRTRWNVRDSQATLILLPEGSRSAGTDWTIQCARDFGRPWRIVEPASADAAGEVRSWLEEGRIAVLNVAGPRESEFPGIYQVVFQFMMCLFLDDEKKQGM